jgi:hypothetical protein
VIPSRQTPEAAKSGYSIDAMDWGTVELEPEVRDWLRSLDQDTVNHVAFYIDLQAERGPLLSEPHTRQLDGKLRELRFWLGTRQTRISYWIASGRRIILLTVWHKRRCARPPRSNGLSEHCEDARTSGTLWTRRSRDRADRVD